ncbi:MAG: hypothetical protein A2X36_16320 [Elusimicrobia bacterium GWA2_69_24]|nr:MAG: hypothetical protein A2X36_16320 [Elusimicrobia bacterium GWA2_69_24]
MHPAFLSLPLSLLAAVAFAEPDDSSLLKGLPDAPAAVAGAPVVSPMSAMPEKPRYSKQSGKDLFYFSAEEVAAVPKRFGPMSKEFAAMKYTFDSDVPADIQSQMRDDLAFIGGLQGQGASKLHAQIFGAVDGAAYTRFFESRVKGIGMDDCGNGNAVACVIPFFNPWKMWLTQNYIRFSHPQVSRMMVVFHEARHTEVSHGNYPHASCPEPFRDENGNDMTSIWTGASLAGEPACDKTPFGSYGSSMIMLKNIQKFCSSCTDKVKMDAGLYADDQFGRVTDAKARKQIIDDLYR